MSTLSEPVVRFSAGAVRRAATLRSPVVLECSAPSAGGDVAGCRSCWRTAPRRRWRRCRRRSCWSAARGRRSATLTVAGRVGAQRVGCRWRRCRCRWCWRTARWCRWRRCRCRSCWRSAPGSRWRRWRCRVVLENSAPMPSGDVEAAVGEVGHHRAAQADVVVAGKGSVEEEVVPPAATLYVGVEVDAAGVGAAGRGSRDAALIASATAVASASIRVRPRAVGWQGLRRCVGGHRGCFLSDRAWPRACWPAAGEVRRLVSTGLACLSWLFANRRGMSGARQPPAPSGAPIGKPLRVAQSLEDRDLVDLRAFTPTA